MPSYIGLGLKIVSRFTLIIKVLHANVETGDLTLIGEAKQSGLLTISSKIQPSIKELKLINQSITGLFEQETDLLK